MFNTPAEKASHQVRWQVALVALIIAGLALSQVWIVRQQGSSALRGGSAEGAPPPATIIIALRTATPAVQSGPPTAIPPISYTTDRPGPGSNCYQGIGIWSRDSLSTTTFVCLVDGLHLTQAAGATSAASVHFSLPDQPIATVSTVRLHIVSFATTGSCVGMGIRLITPGGIYAFICGDGNWDIVSQAASGGATVLRAGQSVVGTAVDLQIHTSDTAISLLINQQLVAGDVAIPANTPQTAGIDLVVDSGPTAGMTPRAQGAGAILTGFLYTNS